MRSGLLVIPIALLQFYVVACKGQELAGQLSKAAFRDSIRPILLARCYECHGGRKTSGDFDLSTREKLVESGMIEPGDAQASWLIKLLRHEEEPHMPFKKERMPESEISKVVDWINAGAPYDGPLDADQKRPSKSVAMQVTDEDRQFWSFRRLAPVTPPRPRDSNWCKNPVDQFVLAKLSEGMLRPSPEALKRQLLRRACFDLIGLPPSPETTAEFLADQSPDAYERLIDRLLDSAHFGERWARHWLDVARYAESHGFEHDHLRDSAYHYRDFVILAFNADMPYDQFARWQIAGDELAPEDPMAIAATGFLAAGVHNTQITANQVEKERYDELDDIVNTTGTAMLGLTVGCARCHDHKYDPIPTADYYRFVANFTTTVRSETELEFDVERYRREKEQFNERLAPRVTARTKYELDVLPEKFEQWLAEVRAPINLDPLPEWNVLAPVEFSTTGYPRDVQPAALTRLDDDSIQASGSSQLKADYTVIVETRLRSLTALRLEAIADDSLPRGGPGRAGNGNFALSDFSAVAQPLGGKAPSTRVQFVAATATFQQNDGDLSAKASIDGDLVSGWAVDHGGIGKNQAAVFRFDSPIDYEHGVRLTIRLKFNNNSHHSLGRFRLSVSSVADPKAMLGNDMPQRIAEALWSFAARQSGAGNLRQAREDLQPQERAALQYWFRALDPGWRQLDDRIRLVAATAPKRNIAKVLFCGEGVKPLRLSTQGKDFFEKTYQLQRGDPNQKLSEAQPGFLQIAMTSPERAGKWRATPPSGAKSSYRRAALANWMTDVDDGAGHLLARVIVNRLWQHHFGRGIVATPSDFGLQGELPSHPELLDWLAQELVRGGWRLKPLHRLMMTSAAYRQDSRFVEASAKIDPNNRLLWRHAPRRLEGEIIRDSMLVVSGELDPALYGPGRLEDDHKRRSIYFFQRRSQLPRMIAQFDGPDTLGGLPERATTTVAPQALLLMNNAQVDTWARQFATRLSKTSFSSHGEVVDAAYRIALAREPLDSERAAAIAFLERQGASYGQDRNGAELALADFCKAILCLNEFVYVN